MRKYEGYHEHFGTDINAGTKITILCVIESWSISEYGKRNVLVYYRNNLTRHNWFH